MKPPLPVLLLGLVCGGVQAAHVTDKLAVGLYDTAEAEQPKRVLTSGTPVEVLERGKKMCRVRLGDGERGWLECRYLTDEIPARVMLVEAQAKAGRLWDELAAVKKTLEEKELHIGELERRLQATEHLLAGTDRPQDAEPASAATPQTTELTPATPRSEGWPTAWTGAAAGLLAGLSTGAWLMRRRIRKRFSGLHI